jgi:DNA segregation ATPase FtsK/SpoIIIE-like protein
LGRRRKKKVTYDSKETSTFAGLIFVLLGIFFFVAIFSGSDGSETLFTQAKDIFGQTTIFAGAFFVLLGTRFLGLRNKLTKSVALLSQLLIVILLAGIASGMSDEPWVNINADPALSDGGHVGYQVISTGFGDGFPAQTATLLILGSLVALFLPVAFAIPLSQIVHRIKIVLSFLWKHIRTLFFESDEDKSLKEEVKNEDIKKASKFGDFNDLLKQKAKNALHIDDDQDDEPLEEVKLPEVIKKKVSNEDIEYKEGALGEDGLSTDALQYPDWQLPPLSLLTPFKKSQVKEDAIDQNAEIIEQILRSFAIEAEVKEAFIGPSVIQYALDIPLGIKVNKISNLSENIALALGVDSKAVRIESIPETTYLGIEVPRSHRDLVRIKELMSSQAMKGASKKLPVPVGKDIHGNTEVAYIEKMPHLLIAGATGSGKSILTNTFITSMIMNRTPDELRLILVDPKQVELMDYDGIPHLLTPVITDMDKVVNALKWSVGEMERRYTKLRLNKVRNIGEFNDKMGFAAMPYLVIVIDEMADMMMTSNRVESENAIVRLAQKARAVGIHLILATQRPSVNVITGIIKANIPGRVGMSVTSSTDSRVILDSIGAESLMGSGDLLYKAPDKTKAVRLQCAFIEQEEINRVCDFIRAQAPEVEYITEITEKHVTDAEATAEALGELSEDNLVENAIRIVVQAQKGSASYLQRRLGIGFNRAARLLDELEEAGVVGPQNGSKPREVLVSDADGFIEMLKQG